MIVMFGFLKKKLKSLLGKSKEIEQKEAGDEQLIDEQRPAEQKPKTKEEILEPKEEEEKIIKPEEEIVEKPSEKKTEAEKEEILEPKEEEAEPDSEQEKKEEILKPEEAAKEARLDVKEIVKRKPVEKRPEAEKEEKKAGGLLSKIGKALGKKDEVEKQKRIKELAEEIHEKEKGLLSGLLKRVSEKELGEKDLKKFMDEFELILMENNVALEVVEKISSELKNRLIGKKVNRSNAEKIMFAALKSAMLSVFNQGKIDIEKKIQSSDKPFVIILVGFNGVGKTTTLAKLVHFFLNRGKTVVVAAGDTFRAAALEQIEIHAKNLGVDVIKHKYGADSAAVIYDAIEHAKSKNIDIVIADTAGRNHADINLMDELKKIKRVDKPDLSILVIDTLTGNDAVEQAKRFDKAIGVDGIILAKADVAEKGGAALSVGYVTGKPILFLGTGQNYEDLEIFDAEKLVNELLE